jgi:hypothetical protein
MLQLSQAIVRLTLFTLLMAAATAINAESLETLLMPGPVTKAHEKYEQDCKQCHDTSSKESQGQLCVKCHDHENIADDLVKNTGFHGRLPEKSRDNCKHCHTEHQGRDANIALLNTSTFDHSNTDFSLKGIHEKTSCKECHKPDKKYAEAPGDCYSCHKKSDVHDGKQGKKCGNCHTPKGWKESEFDHDKTDFPLKGAHKESSCAACHINQKYKDTPKTCISCHQINDVHRGNFGDKCETCHESSKWDKAAFDHDKKTDFPLFGQHKKAKCHSCHEPVEIKPGGKRKKLPTECFDCHKNDDSHKGRYGKKCEDCHTSSSWQKQKFNHDKGTDFPLLGEHKEVACNQCHKGDLYKDKVKSDCISCHKKDDVHKGKQGLECNNCHNEKGWHSDVRFDHDLTSFPLIGMHATTQCGECHLTAEYGSTESACNHCHADNDVHKTRLGTDCESCHNPNSWETWLFDHNKATRFKIDGAHEELGCYDCHQTKSKGKLKALKDCIDCHRSQDIHNRQFGRHCSDCHSTKSFKDININKLK